jgi:hypothetical protein
MQADVSLAHVQFVTTPPVSWHTLDVMNYRGGHRFGMVLLVTHPDATSPLPFTTARTSPTTWGHRSQCVRPPYCRGRWRDRLRTDDTTQRHFWTCACGGTPTSRTAYSTSPTQVAELASAHDEALPWGDRTGFTTHRCWPWLVSPARSGREHYPLPLRR